jgi:molybdopterin converting factor small subunit
MRIGYYGKLRGALGDSEELAVEQGETVSALRRRLAALHPVVASDLLSPRVRACVGDSIVGEDFCLDGHDGIEFLPPLSGG